MSQETQAQQSEHLGVAAQGKRSCRHGGIGALGAGQKVAGIQSLSPIVAKIQVEQQGAQYSLQEMADVVAEGASTECWTEVQQFGNEDPSEQDHSENVNVSSSPP